MKAIQFMEDMQEATTVDLAVYTDQSPSAGRNMVRAFVEAKLIEHVRNEPGGRGKEHAVYRIVAGAKVKASQLYPTEIEGKEFAPRVPTRTPGQHLMADEYRPPQPLSSVRVRRDPLVIALCGHGRAPSLNFMDSNQGGENADA